MNEEIWFDIDDGFAAAPGVDTRSVGGGLRGRGGDRHDAVGRRLVGLAILCAALFGLATLAGFAAEAYAAPPGPTRIVETPGTLVDIPAAVLPHEGGDMVVSRVVPDLRWLAAEYPIFVTDSYSGRTVGASR